MQEFPKGGLIGKAIRGWIVIQELRIPLRAAYAGYFIVLSVFPALLLVLSCLRYTGLEVESLIELLNGVLPEAMLDMAEELVYSTYRNASGAVAGLSALIALWSSSKGIYGLMTGLNAVYGLEENRGFFYTRSVSVLYALIFLLVLLLTLVLNVFGNTLIDLLHNIDNALLIRLVDLLDLRFFFLLILQTVLFTLMFMALPNGRRGFWASLPGALLSSVGWMTFSKGYSIYVSHFPSYANIYGSVYGIAISMLWLYFCLSILLYGGALNRYLMGREKK